MKWTYRAETLGGNFFAAAKWITENHPEWDVVTMEMSGHYTIVVYRVEIPVYRYIVDDPSP